MTAARTAVSASYSSGVNPNQYTFEVLIPTSGVPEVRNIRTPQGQIRDTFTGLPQSVVDDICEAIQTTEDILAATSAVNGTLTFTASTTASFTFTTPLSNTSYRVYVEKIQPLDYSVTTKTTTGFTVQLTTAYTGDLGFDVFL